MFLWLGAGLVSVFALLNWVAPGCPPTKPSLPSPPTAPVSRMVYEAPPARPSVRLRDAVAANNAFALALYARVGADTEGSLALCPVGLSLALTTATAGARGETQDEMARVLGLPFPEPVMRPAVRALQARVTGPDPSQR